MNRVTDAAILRLTKCIMASRDPHGVVLSLEMLLPVIQEEAAARNILAFAGVLGRQKEKASHLTPSKAE